MKKLNGMSGPPKPAEPTLAELKSSTGSATDPAGLGMERRALLFVSAAIAAGTLANKASAAPGAPDLSAALAKFRATIPSHFNRDYVENAVIPFFLGSIF